MPIAKPLVVPPISELSRTCAPPRLRHSLAALGSGYGLNERTGGLALGTG